jgi:hypothetical protein
LVRYRDPLPSSLPAGHPHSLVGPVSPIFIRFPHNFVMTVPKPLINLEGHCSVISGNTLYAYTPNGFVSIDLRVNGTWVSLPSGVSVSNPVCLKGGIEGSSNEDEALYVVGGTTTNSTSPYTGLQRFSFKDSKWDTLGSGTTLMTDLTGHGAGFVAASSSIIIYAGNTGASTSTALSSQTYLISTISPYVSTSVLNQGAPSLNNPQILPWNSTHVGMFSGNDGSGGSKAVWTYNVATGWESSPVSLPSAISTSTPLSLLSGSGDSKVLQYFDMNASPNSVTNLELITSDGAPKSPAVAVGSSSKKRSTGSYPTYNDTLAPSYKWSDYALAQGSNGLVVLSSGKSNDSVAIFNQTSNSWVNSTELFYGKTVQDVLTTNTTTSTTMTPTATPTPSTSTSATPSSSTTAAAAAAGGSGTDVKVIIGAVLGAVCGVGIILLLLLWLLKRERTKRERNGQSRGIDKDRLSFQDQGIEPLAGGAYPMAKSPVPVASMSADSLAIISGKYAGEKSLMPPSNSGYGLSATPRKSSPLSPIPSSGLAPSSMYSESAYRDSTTPSEMGHKPGDRTTDEGWGKYFQDNNTTNLGGMPADRSTTSSIYTKSDYRGSAWPMSNLTPLNLGFLDQPKPLGRVYSGSPTTEHASSSRSLAIPEGQSARISSADSISVTSDDDPHDTNWTGAHTSWLGRPASSNYSTSFYNSSSRDLPSSNPQFPRHSNGRRSSVAIPDDIDELPMPGRSQNVNSDMSWLNLQAER